MSTPDRIALERLAQRAEAYLTREADAPTRASLRREFFEALNDAWDVLRPNEPPLWRFDVPDIPEHVTAFKDRNDAVWLRLANDEWVLATWDPEYIRRLEKDAAETDRKVGYPLADLLDDAPLVECPDPRKDKP